MTIRPETSEHRPAAKPVSHRDQTLFFRLALGTGFLAGGLGVLFAVDGFKQPSGGLGWEYFILALTFGVAAILCFVAGSGRLVNTPIHRTLYITFTVQVAMVILAALVEGMGIPAALIVLVYTFMVGFLSVSIQRSNLIVTAGIFSAILISILSLFSPFPQLSSPALEIYMPALLGILVMVYATMLLMEFVVATLGVKLVSAALAMALIPLILFSFIQTSFTRNALFKESTGSLHMAALQTANRLDEFLTTNLSNVTSHAANPAFRQYIALPEDQRQGSSVEANLQEAIESIKSVTITGYVDSIALLDADGRNIYDTLPANVNQNEKSRDYFTVPFSLPKGYVSSVYFLPDGKGYMVFSTAIRNSELESVGVLRVRYQGIVLQKLADSFKGLLGEQSYPMIVDDRMIRLADGSTTRLMYQPVVDLTPLKQNDLIISNRLPSSFVEQEDARIPELVRTIENGLEEPFFTFSGTAEGEEIESAGAVLQLRFAPWYLVYSQRQDTFKELLAQQSRTTMLLATIIASVVSLAATLMSRFFSGNITKLTLAAEQISAGEYDVSAPAEDNDEIGTLGKAFNAMASQVRTLINELEARVAARTAELLKQNASLRYRTEQLKTVSDVARSIASTLELETLLNQVSMLVSHRFSFYHVGIFLVDERGEYAVLRASNSEGGRRMLARQHMLKVGQVGIVGNACGMGEARIATDVGQDAAYFNNPDLPLTRSEMALPLKAGDRIIGALDVQSTEPNAFSEEDIELFGVLADQVAIAIVNNRLYAETSQALEEVQDLHRQYLRSEWNRETSTRKHLSYRYTPNGVQAQEAAVHPDIEQVLETGQALVEDALIDRGESRDARMAIPIMLRGEPIGVIHLQEPGQQEREWSPGEVETVQAVADQIALALENARLFEQTTRRAERERKVLEITSKIRATNDFQAMLRIAVEELQGALNASRTQVILQGPEASGPPPQPGGNGHDRRETRE